MGEGANGYAACISQSKGGQTLTGRTHSATLLSRSAFYYYYIYINFFIYKYIFIKRDNKYCRLRIKYEKNMFFF